MGKGTKVLIVCDFSLFCSWHWEQDWPVKTDKQINKQIEIIGWIHAWAATKAVGEPFSMENIWEAECK